jgi:hypothetical protein
MISKIYRYRPFTTEYASVQCKATQSTAIRFDKTNISLHEKSPFDLKIFVLPVPERSEGYLFLIFPKTKTNPEIFF